MKLKKLLSALVAGAMVLSTIAAVPAFAEDESMSISQFIDAVNNTESGVYDGNGATVKIETGSYCLNNNHTTCPDEYSKDDNANAPQRIQGTNVQYQLF